jgi:hypothetical protein
MEYRIQKCPRASALLLGPLIFESNIFILLNIYSLLIAKQRIIPYSIIKNISSNPMGGG